MLLLLLVVDASSSLGSLSSDNRGGRSVERSAAAALFSSSCFMLASIPVNSAAMSKLRSVLSSPSNRSRRYRAGARVGSFT